MSYNPLMAGPDSPTEDLVRDFQHGDDADGAFQLLFRRHFGQVQWFFQRKGIPAEDSRDMTQDVFFSVYRGLPQLEHPAQFMSWLFVIARNVFHHHLEKEHAQKRFGAAAATAGQTRSSVEPDAMPDRRSASATDILLDREKVAKLGEAMRTLPAQMRHCLHLRAAEECSYEDIATILGISVGAVKSHIHRAREKLRQEMQPYFGHVPI